jgi:hypothetical protein
MPFHGPHSDAFRRWGLRWLTAAEAFFLSIGYAMPEGMP